MERIPNRNSILRKQDEIMTKTPHEYIRVTHEYIRVTYVCFFTNFALIFIFLTSFLDEDLTITYSRF